jgi:GNAT superfamily N-acetyltransferase
MLMTAAGVVEADLDLTISTLAERPDLEPSLWSLTGEWPAFMLQDPIADLYFADFERVFPEFALVAYDERQPERLVARAFSVPFAFGPDVRRERLPDDGWDGIVRWAWLDRVRERKTTHVSALDITVASEYRGFGLSSRMLAALRDNAQRLGYAELVAPVRPSGKQRGPETSMSEYARETRDDGMPTDPWLRTHVRAGGEIEGVCPRSMVIAGTLAEWRGWTGLPFDRTEDVVVPGALVPVRATVEHDTAVYVEPNVWVRHRLA